MEFFRHAENWVLVSFLLFIALLLYLKVPAMIGKMLDDHAAGVKSELDQARKLREEAEALLADYKKKQADAEAQARDIVASAKTDAEQYAADARRKLAEQLDRRAKQAEAKIARAEAQAMADVRARASELATSAAAQLLGEAAKGKKGSDLIAESISAVKSRLN